MTDNYSSIQAHFNWVSVFGESNDAFTTVEKTKLAQSIEAIQSSMIKRDYEKKCLRLKIAIQTSKAQQFDHDKILSNINYVNSLRQKYTSLLNTILSLYLVVSDANNDSQDEFFDKYEFYQTQVFTFFAAIISYLRLLAVLLEIFLAEEEDRKLVFWKRKFVLMNDILSSIVHSLRVAYLMAKDYEMLPILNTVIFSIDTLVAICDFFEMMHEYHQELKEAISNISCLNPEEYLQKNYQERLHFLNEKFSMLETSSDEKVQLLNLIILEQKYQLDFWKKSINFLLCALILIAFLLLQQYLVISISGVLVSDAFLKCLGFLIISVCYNIRDWILDYFIPHQLSKNACSLSHEGMQVELQNGQVLHQQQKTFLADMFNIENCIGLLTSGLVIGILASGGAFWAALLLLFIGMLIKEYMKKTHHPEIEKIDVTDVVHEHNHNIS